MAKGTDGVWCDGGAFGAAEPKLSYDFIADVVWICMACRNVDSSCWNERQMTVKEGVAAVGHKG